MGEQSKIEWTDHTFNPWLGCTKVSDGCKFCYAEVSQPVVMRKGGPVLWGLHADRQRTAASTWRQPLTWDRKAAKEGVRYRVFCASLADVFEDRRDLDGWRLELWELIRQTPNLDWLLLTKRPHVMAAWAAEHGWPDNAWAGTTVEDQQRADERIPHLLNVPARVRFLSCEPLLGPVDLGGIPGAGCGRLGCKGTTVDALSGADQCEHGYWAGPTRPGEMLPAGISWAIVGGESGPKARPMHPQWPRSLRDQCIAAGVAFLFKQWGEWVTEDQSPDDIVLPGRSLMAWSAADGTGDQAAVFKVGKKAAGRLLDGRTWDEVPRV